MLETKKYRCRPEASHSTIGALTPNVISPPSPVPATTNGLTNATDFDCQWSLVYEVSCRHALLFLYHTSLLSPRSKRQPQSMSPHQSNLLRRSVISTRESLVPPPPKKKGPLVCFGLVRLGVLCRITGGSTILVTSAIYGLTPSFSNRKDSLGPLYYALIRALTADAVLKPAYTAASLEPPTKGGRLFWRHRKSTRR